MTAPPQQTYYLRSSKKMGNVLPLNPFYPSAPRRKRRKLSKEDRDLERAIAASLGIEYNTNNKQHITPSPISPSMSTSPPSQIPSFNVHPKNTTKNKNPRKRRFHQILDDDPNNIDLNIAPTNNKKPKLSKTVKFTLNEEVIDIREASLSKNSRLISNKPRHRRCIEDFEIIKPTTTRMTRLRKNPYLCCYEFLNGFKIGIAMTLGSGNDIRSAIKILSQDLVSTRAKAAIQTQKNSF